ncbi:putative ABC transporter ATP-binding protein [Aliiroseovarius pelagivivens]|uniref:Putative ABC transporter ATP-binding protein n=1 Tax=Aliiroseovarius pelagivivens TaxID=1639690 RepID=A0A2R8AM69_9RHOB|nr:ABC transporter ATP-binding protein [Aliiroseovarius pelagivivens]SPF77142.1 putative ABC transporter ATP-binding protein [Aliiroseovarius pelagivivens]
MVNALQVSDLTVSTPGTKPLLNGLEFSIRSGERVGLVGASGCGKSLAAAALTGLLRPPLALTHGTIRIDGQDIGDASPRVWRMHRGRRIFQIFQSPSTALTPTRRIGPQLAEAARIAGDTSGTAVERALETVSLAPHVAGFFPYQLSGGMKQRVLIAMALILRPNILIADEPTTGLDVLTERDVLAALNTMADETGAALLFISHDLRAVAEVASRTLVMENGRLVEDAPIAELAQSKAPAARQLAKAADALQAAC